MPYRIEKIENDNIIYIDLQAPFDMADDLPKVYADIAAVASQMEPPIYRIMDLEGSNLNFGDVVAALQSGTRGGDGSLRDWRFKPLYVGTDKMAELVVNSLKQDQYGNVESRLFTSRDAAIQYVRQQLKRKPNA